MLELLTTFPFPELAAIAESGQKHIIFRAPRNPAGQASGLGLMLFGPASGGE
jgi:hypothetical protein